MKRIILIAMLILGSATIFSGEIDDFRFAIGLYRDQNYSLAKAVLQKFINNYPDSNSAENARLLLANIHLYNNNYSEALQHYEKLYTSSTEPSIRPEIYLGLAQCYFFTQETERAHNILTRFLREFRQHRSSWQAYYFLGRIEYQRGNLPAAINNLENAAQISPDWQIKVAKVETLLAMNNAEQTLELIDPHISEGTKNEYLFQMIVLYLNHLLERQDYQNVISYAYEYIPVSSQYYDDYLLVLSEAKYELEEYTLALDRLDMMQRESERARYIKALCHMDLNNHATAERLFTELSRDAQNIEIRSNSYFFLASLHGRENIQDANRMLEQFISENPQHPFIGAAHYQIALNHFRIDSFTDSINGFERAIDIGVNEEFRERAEFLTAESYFQLGQRQAAKDRYEIYLTEYPQGAFVDEALFKTGLHYYENDDKPNALVRFDRIINEYPDSDRVSMALFYHGEIFAGGGQYDIAINKYQQALPGFDDKGLLWLRIAQVNFLQGNYDETLTDLSNVPDTPDFLYEKNIITGNVYFARRNYLESLRSFEAATRYSTNNDQWADAVLRQARTLYQLGEYREATDLYRRLYERAPAEQYLLMAATAAFTAEDYHAAIQYYENYINSYPYSDNYYRAKLHIADSYYNLRDYERAAENYRRLITPDMDSSILNNSLNGLEWSALQSDQIDFPDMINQVIRTDSPSEFLLILYDRKINYYYSQQQWHEVINTGRFIDQLSPAEPRLYEYRRLRAIAHTHLNQLDDAERIFNELHKQKADPSVLYAWARLDLAREDRASALEKIRQATHLTQESRIWLDMLRLSVALNDRRFREDYNRFREFARGADREQAMLLLVEWNLQNNRYDEAQITINTLLQSSYEPIKAKAQYYKGVHLYETGKVNEAIPELLRVRYLFPRIEDVRLDAEMLAIRAYVDINDKENARKIYDAIESSLTPEQRSQIRSVLED